MQISFGRVLYSEWQKTKNIWGFTMSLLGPLAVSLIMVYAFFHNAEKASNATNPWNDLALHTYQFYFLLYPLFAALAAFLLSNIEHKNQGFKQIFSLPAPKSYFYFSKVLILLSWIFCSLVLAGLLIGISGKFLGMAIPAYGFQEYQPENITWIYLFRMFISLLSILSIHFFLSLYWDNFIISIGAAVFLLVLGMTIYNNWEYAYLFPYTYPVQHFIEFRTGIAPIWGREAWISLAYTVFFFGAGYYWVSRKNIAA